MTIADSCSSSSDCTMVLTGPLGFDNGPPRSIAPRKADHLIIGCPTSKCMAQSLVTSNWPNQLLRRRSRITRQVQPSVRACGLCHTKGRVRLPQTSRSAVQLCHIRKQNTDADKTGEQVEQYAASNINPQTRAAISIVQAYKDLISPLLPSVCRFLPSCSTYSVQAFEQFGGGKGMVLMAWRIVRCNPFRGGYQGQYDPPQWPPVGLEAVFRQ